eukprot:CAMPEP_0174385818 /NCGR_PEP_ID=MMETSP0811_2-20130205/126862_1 /TAXON_ID=73025 ORGANISM="Eutreptiella gymnastica-like, Strain CCMP1594" /NCGR_SAMPLE_ID=MMETSP0811_2 /ASSEMBLY_ACC=CAM_ASM_000667 /LENGTH=120 /DNA_ID=CAMNT_0015540275 /DNA_START=1285 /DNA_END=1645 /DNA_ORIENTATION=-
MAMLGHEEEEEEASPISRRAAWCFTACGNLIYTSVLGMAHTISPPAIPAAPAHSLLVMAKRARPVQWWWRVHGFACGSHAMALQPRTACREGRVQDMPGIVRAARLGQHRDNTHGDRRFC